MKSGFKWALEAEKGRRGKSRQRGNQRRKSEKAGDKEKGKFEGREGVDPPLGIAPISFGPGVTDTTNSPRRDRQCILLHCYLGTICSISILYSLSYQSPHSRAMLVQGPAPGPCILMPLNHVDHPRDPTKILETNVSLFAITSPPPCGKPLDRPVRLMHQSHWGFDRSRGNSRYIPKKKSVYV